MWVHQGWASPWLDVLFTWVSETWTFSFPLLALVLAFSVVRYRWNGARLWLALIVLVGVADISGAVLKDLTLQPRPCYALAGWVRVQCGSSLTGMPSNHALNFFTAAIFLSRTLLTRAWALVLFLAASLVALSRIYLAKHYPSQVLAGVALGLSWGYVGAWLITRYWLRLHNDDAG